MNVATLHGEESKPLRRTNADKRRAVMTLLEDAEWRGWSQEAIARACAVSIGFVSKMKGEIVSLHGEEIKPAVRTVTRNGTTYLQNTANIGRRGREGASLFDVDRQGL